jgi:glycosyltransferase involved in cell wall biosynthesis
MNEPGTPVVTVIVPTMNEASDLASCLQCILAQADSRVEILIVDGGSTDETVSVARRALAGSAPSSKVLVNPGGSTPSNLNRGLDAARGDYVCRVDARSHIPDGYIDRCVALLASRPDVIVVGGAQVTLARSASAKDLGIARALNNRFGMGLARYRRGARSGPSDTVYLGCFRTVQLRDVHGWDERFATNQDFELNRRLARLGTVWFESDLEVGYLPRRGLLPLLRQYHRFGRWKVAYWQMANERPRARQVALLLVPAAGLGVLAVGLGSSRRMQARMVATGGVLVAAFELLGSESPSGPLGAHLYSLVASVLVAGGWTSGVWRQMLSGATLLTPSR